MSFRLFIYYCALCGGWAALVAWLLVMLMNVTTVNSVVLRSMLIAGILGMLLGAGIGGVDAVFNSVGKQRLLRVAISLGVGLVGGLLSGLLGELLYKISVPRFISWMLVGTAIGASVGVFDLLQAAKPSGRRMAIRKTINGLLGGVVGGFVGGLLFSLLAWLSERVQNLDLRRSALAIGLVILGACIGLLIGLAQVILREASVRVEKGMRAGRELLLTKPEITIGRAESCDIGLFGDNAIERTHARILLQGNRYVLADAGTPGGTLLNGERISGPTPLRSDDAIQVGGSILRFKESHKRG